MSRTPSHKRYCKKLERVLPTVWGRKDEAAFIKAMKAKSGLSWLNLVYRGLGLRRSDCLKLIKKGNDVT